eukprot:242215_1
MLPTTVAPSTAIPTTAFPTTFIPTTFMPTTAIPTTFIPTFIPTTDSPTTNSPTTNLPTTMQPTTSIPTERPSITENGAGQVDITTNVPENTNVNNNDVAKSESGINLNNIIMYLIALTGVLLLVFVCTIVIYMRQKRKVKQNNVFKQETDNIDRVDAGMVRVKSTSLEMMNNGNNGYTGQEIMACENGLSPSGPMGVTLGVTLGEDEIINTIVNSVVSNNNNFVDNDNDEGTSDDQSEDLYKDPIENNNVRTAGMNENDDDTSDTPFEPVDVLSSSKGNILTSMGNM